MQAAAEQQEAEEKKAADDAGREGRAAGAGVPSLPLESPSKGSAASRAHAEVLQQLEALNQAVEELSSYMLRGSAAPAADEETLMAYYEHCVDYTDHRPDVEVTVELLSISDFDAQSGTFKASVRVILDWEEKDFKENIHYFYDVRKNKTTLNPKLLEDENSFDPCIYIDNAVECESGNEKPTMRIEREVKRKVDAQERMSTASFKEATSQDRQQSDPRDGGTEYWDLPGEVEHTEETLWLTKQFEFSGTFRCQKNDASHFPFDMQRLPIEVKSHPMPGMTTLGTARKVHLVDPKLRRAAAADARQDRNGQLILDSTTAEKIKYEPAHHWRKIIGSGIKASVEASDDDEQLLSVAVGEMQVCAFGGMPVADETRDIYQIEVVLVRVWSKHFFAFLNFLALAAVSIFCSSFVPFNPDTLASRLSITLAVLVTLVGFSARPSAIELLPYLTYYDWFAKIMLLAVVLTGLENLVVSRFCWGVYRDGLGDDVFGDDLGDKLKFLCQYDESILGSSLADDVWVLICAFVMLASALALMIRSQVYQVSYIMRVQRELAWSATAHHANHHQGLLMRQGQDSQVHFTAQYEDVDIVRAVAIAGMMPLLWIFPHLWAKLCRSRVASSTTSNSTTFMSGTSSGHGPWLTPRGRKVHPVSDSHSEVDLLHHQQTWVEPYYKLPYVDPNEVAYVIDMGSSEVGFWNLSRGYIDGLASRVLFMTGHKKKLSVSFSDQRGMLAKADELVDEIANHLQATGSQLRESRRLNQTSRGRNVKLLLSPTGTNRRELETHSTAMDAMHALVDRCKGLFKQREINADIVLFLLTDELEAEFEFLSTEWLVQHGDLDVMSTPAPGSHDVPFAGCELNQAFMRARRAADRGGLMGLDDFVREFKDITDNETITYEFLQSIFQQAAAESSLEWMSSDFAKLCEAFRNSAPLMRALVKHRLFNGTISVGGGSCQIAMKADDDGMATSSKRRPPPEFHKMGIGNTTPTSPDITGRVVLPDTQEANRSMVEEWRARIKGEFDVQFVEFPEKMNGQMRGLYVGISAVFYAAKTADCSEVILPKALFLKKLTDKLEELLQFPPCPKERGSTKVFDHRDIANLVLVHEIVKRVLHDSAWIVCKRNWRAQPAELHAPQLDLEDEDEQEPPTGGDDAATEASVAPAVDTAAAAAHREEMDDELPEYVAGWVLGFYLNRLHHAAPMS